MKNSLKCIALADIAVFMAMAAHTKARAPAHSDQRSNPIDDGVFQQASNAAIDLYVSMLEAKNITVTVRRSRGKDIDAACGQLANKDQV